ncbi:MAG: hypothetical protein ACLQUY_04690 [Ktedonobacterales bacterium]
MTLHYEPAIGSSPARPFAGARSDTPAAGAPREAAITPDGDLAPTARNSIHSHDRWC